MLISYKRDIAIFFSRMQLCKTEDGNSLHTAIFPESVVPVKTKAEALKEEEIFAWIATTGLHNTSQNSILLSILFHYFGYFSAVAVEVFSV